MAVVPLRRRGSDRWVALAISLGLVLVVAGAGASVTNTDPGSWYDSLEQPSWNPPDWLFGPAWTLLYALMAIAAWRVWVTGERAALNAYGAQLALNLSWTLVFFGTESASGGVVVIVALWIAIVVTIRAFWPVDRVAAWLLVPYLAWVTYAAALNVAIALAAA
jgi:translocator protein